MKPEYDQYLVTFGLSYIISYVTPHQNSLGKIVLMGNCLSKMVLMHAHNIKFKKNL